MWPLTSNSMSSPRKRREAVPQLSRARGDRQFDELAPLLPHAAEIDAAGARAAEPLFDHRDAHARLFQRNCGGERQYPAAGDGDIDVDPFAHASASSIGIGLTGGLPRSRPTAAMSQPRASASILGRGLAAYAALTTPHAAAGQRFQPVHLRDVAFARRRPQRAGSNVLAATNDLLVADRRDEMRWKGVGALERRAETFVVA